MTLIAFSTYGNRAEFITDTLSYTPLLTQLGKASKSVVIPHLDAAVLGQGTHAMTDAGREATLQVAGQVTGFDQLVATAPDWLRATRDHVADKGEDVAESVMFLIGWSEWDEEFQAHAFATDDDFATQRVTGTWVMPAPWSVQPTDLELARMQGWMHDHPDTPEAVRIWSARPEARRPQTRRDWTDLAIATRRERALDGTFARVAVGGKVIHTRLRRGSSETKVIHHFDDSGAELAKMVSWSAHPLALATECHCGSGRTFGECCSLLSREVRGGSEAVVGGGG